jgi:hypothetical protein
MHPTKRENPAPSHLLAVDRSSITSFLKCRTNPRLDRINDLKVDERHHGAVNSAIEFEFRPNYATTCGV